MPPRKKADAAAGGAGPSTDAGASKGADTAGAVNEILAVCPLADKSGEWVSLQLAVEWMGEEWKGKPWEVSLSSFGPNAGAALKGAHARTRALRVRALRR
jgi:hypothetical protein